MNIFRILAQGDGAIQEPNISAFLGYLLDPNEDHGLGSSFLEQFLKLHYNFEKFNHKEKNEEKEEIINNKSNLKWLVDNEEDGKIKDLSQSGDFEIKVFFEQAFAGSVKSIVDIMLIVHEMPKGDKKEQYFKNYIKNEKKLKHVFLIEVKIKDSACQNGKDDKEGQLLQQVISSRKVIKDLLKDKGDVDFDIKKDISIIFVVPDLLNKEKSKSDLDTRARIAFREVVKNEVKDNADTVKENPKSIIFWNSIRNNEDEILNNASIEKTIDNILYATHKDKAEPIPQYTLDTLKSFSNFIYSDFSYKYKRLPSFERDNIDSLEEFKKKYKESGILNNESWKRIEECESSIKTIGEDIKLKFSETHPLSVYFKKKKIFSLTKYSNNLIFHFATRNYNLRLDKESIELLTQQYKCTYKEEFKNKEGKPIYAFYNTNEVPLQVIIKLLSNIIKRINE